MPEGTKFVWNAPWHRFEVVRLDNVCLAWIFQLKDEQPHWHTLLWAGTNISDTEREEISDYVEYLEARAPWRGEDGQNEDHVAFNEEQLWQDG